MITPKRLSLLAGLILGAGAVHAATPIMFPNAGFETGLDSWNAAQTDKDASLSTAKPTSAHTGKMGLNVTQKEGDPGSWLQSSRMPVAASKAYRIEFWSRVNSNSGIGVWVQFYDSERQVIKPANGDVTLQFQPDATAWTKQSLDITTPAGTEFISLAIHGYNKRTVSVDFDDFSITPVDGSMPASTAAKPAASVKPIPAGTGSSVITPSAARIKEIAAALPAKARGIGPTIADRAIWDELGANAEWKEKAIARGVRFMNEPIPVVAPEAYEASVKSGDRKIDPITNQRRFRLVTFVVAEGLENKGRFIPVIEKEVAAICEEPSWILSAHVQFSTGRNDLGTAMTAWNLATVDTMLGDKLSAGLRKTIRDRVRDRLLNFYLDEIRGKTKLEWWATDANNWNAVVHGGIVGAALALDDSVAERAEIIAAAELGTQFYIKSFPSDGYSPEGMGYWKYGFGHYVLLSEAVYVSTGGKINFYDRDNIRNVAQFPRRFEMSSGLYPSFGDALFLEVPAPWLGHIIDRRYGLEDGTPRTLTPDPTFSAFLYSYGAILGFDSKAPPIITKGATVPRGHRVRDWFEKSQIYIGRSTAPSPDALNIAIKGDNNGVSHGHNDLGTFVVSRGGLPVLVDPGVTNYNSVTMGPKAFEYQIKGSYGHSVPLVAGQWQKRGSQFASTVKEQRFTDAADSLTFDLAAGYGQESVKELTRRFDFSRTGNGALTITDHVAFTSPQAFGTALLTYGVGKEESPGVWIVTYKGQSVRAEITTSGNQAFTVTDEVLKDKSREGDARRLGINLTEPTSDATITIKVTAP